MKGGGSGEYNPRNRFPLHPPFRKGGNLTLSSWIPTRKSDEPKLGKSYTVPISSFLPISASHTLVCSLKRGGIPPKALRSRASRDLFCYPRRSQIRNAFRTLN